jgi:hypothetical protein
MRRVDDDQTLDLFRVLCRQVPGHGAAPVMRHQDAARVTQMGDELAQVLDHQRRAVGLDRLRLVGAVEAAQVGGHHVVIAGKFLELGVPGVAELGEAVHEQHQRPLARAEVVQADAVDLCVLVLHHGLR